MDSTNVGRRKPTTTEIDDDYREDPETAITTANAETRTNMTAE